MRPTYPKHPIAYMLIATIILVAICTVLNAEPQMPNSDQSLAKMLWGRPALDVWEHRFTSSDTLSYAFIFVNPDSADTLDATPAPIIFTSTVYGSLITYGAADHWIDEDRQRFKPGESKIMPIRTRGI